MKIWPVVQKVVSLPFPLNAGLESQGSGRKSRPVASANASVCTVTHTLRNALGSAPEHSSVCTSFRGAERTTYSVWTYSFAHIEPGYLVWAIKRSADRERAGITLSRGLPAGPDPVRPRTNNSLAREKEVKQEDEVHARVLSLTIWRHSLLQPTPIIQINCLLIIQGREVTTALCAALCGRNWHTHGSSG